MNEPQKRAILFSCLDVHRRLADMESMLAQSLTPSPFSRYTNDLSPVEREAVRAHFARIRAAMLAGLQEAGVPLEVPRRNVRWALHCGMAALDVAVTDLSPDRLRAHGSLDAEGRAQAGHIRWEIGRLIDRADACLLGLEQARETVAGWGSDGEEGEAPHGPSTLVRAPPAAGG
jgi:hypothetical protein